jgi:hypothetical protein
VRFGCFYNFLEYGPLGVHLRTFCCPLDLTGHQMDPRGALRAPTSSISCSQTFFVANTDGRQHRRIGVRITREHRPSSGGSMKAPNITYMPTYHFDTCEYEVGSVRAQIASRGAWLPLAPHSWGRLEKDTTTGREHMFPEFAVFDYVYMIHQPTPILSNTW